MKINFTEGEMMYSSELEDEYCVIHFKKFIGENE